MIRLPALIVIALALSLSASAQNSNPAPTPAPPSATQADKQNNAASATQDNSAISGDQVTKPAGAKNSTVTGCLGSPDSDGRFVLKSMQYRSGVEVLGPNDLGKAAGEKVKLTGQWVPGSESRETATGSQDPASKKNRRFQATSFEVLADKCPPPAETTPISKKKQKQQKADVASQN
jgi:hypothetical protein